MTTPRARLRRQKRRRRLIPVALLVVVATYFGFDAFDILPGPFTTKPPITVQALPRPEPHGAPAPEMASLPDSAPVPSDLTPVLDPIFDSARTSEAYSAEVRDARTGDVLYARNPDQPRTPASVTKVLTASAALGALGPTHTFSTDALLAGDQLFVRGGGDVLLNSGASQPASVAGHAGLATLAESVADKLQGRGLGSLTLHADVSRYTGENFRAGWDRADIGNGFIAPIVPIMVDAGLTAPKDHVPREQDPVARVVSDFAAALTKAGIEVRVAEPAATPGNAETLASVESAPLGSVVRYMLLHSDNVVAEVLGVEVAIARKAEPSLDASPQAVLDQLTSMQLETNSVTLGDTSGLNYDNRISPHQLTGVLNAATTRADVSELIPNFPVGGLSGTLTERFTDPDTEPAKGMVMAKTGTLSTVTSLAGTVLTHDGRLLTFAFMSDGLDAGGSTLARKTMDTAVTQLAECGCSQ